MSSVDQGWETPEEVLELVRQMGPIGLDPCTTDENPTGAEDYYTDYDDGLSQSWMGFGLVYANPPYSRSLKPWTAKMAVEASRGVEIVGLVPARTDTQWFQRNLLTCKAVCFWGGRLTFKGAPAPAPFPSCLPYWGSRVDLFAEIFCPHGWVVRP
jgi:phage N-6-adenine-methyltransferase